MISIEKLTLIDWFYTFSEMEDGSESGYYIGWMGHGSGGWSANENWDENESSDWNKKFTQHEDYSATLNYSYIINQNGIRSNESFDETISGSGEIDRMSNDNESLNEEHSFSEGSWSGYASRYTKQDTQTKLDDKTSNTYNFDVSRSSLTDTLTPENHLDSSRHSTKTVSGEYYLHTTFGGGGSPGGSETITDPLHDYAPIDEDHSETNSSPGFANQNSLPKLMKPLTTDGATGGIKGNYPAASTDSPPGPTKVKVDIPLINKGTPSYGNFGIPDVDAALNPPQPPQPVTADVNPPIANNSQSSDNWLDYLQEGIGWLGFAPGVGAVPDLVNAGIYTLRGNYKEAAISGFFAIPIIGDAASAGRKAAKAAGKVADVASGAAGQITKHADDIVDAGKKSVENVPVPGTYRPSTPLPRDQYGNPIPSSSSPHTQIGTKNGSKGPYTQAREFGENGQLVKDIDFTNHGRPNIHPNPHQHRWVPNPTGGNPIRNKPEPLDF